MEGIVKWICENKEWLFSGVAIAVLGYIVKVVYAFSNNKKNKAGSHKPSQSQTNNQTQNVTVNIPQPLIQQIPMIEDAKVMAEALNIEGMRAQTNILFIDDDKKFKIVSIIKSSGWKNTTFFPNPDVKDINDERIRKAHIIFVDILGVAKTLYEDEGLGLAADLKKKYPEKKIVIYSAEPAHQSFHEAWKITDDRIQKNAQPAEFISCIETLADSIWKKE